MLRAAVHEAVLDRTERDGAVAEGASDALEADIGGAAVDGGAGAEELDAAVADEVAGEPRGERGASVTPSSVEYGGSPVVWCSNVPLACIRPGWRWARAVACTNATGAIRVRPAPARPAG